MTQWVPIPEAARRLGISIPTLKRHIKGQKVAARLDPHVKGQRWLVEVPTEDPGPAAAPPVPPVPATEMIDQLRTQLVEKDQQIRELHVLLREALALRHLLLAAAPPPADLAPEAPVITQTEAPDHAATVPRQDQPEAAEVPTKRAWWRRILTGR